MNYLFFDAEYILNKNKAPSIISLGIIDRTAIEGSYKRGFYGEVNINNLSSIEDYINLKVINGFTLQDIEDNTEIIIDHVTMVKGNISYIYNRLLEWLAKYKYSNDLFFVSDFCYYDSNEFLNVDSFKNIFNLPNNINYNKKDFYTIETNMVDKMLLKHRRDELYEELVQINRDKELNTFLTGKGKYNSLFNAYKISYIFRVKEFILDGVE